MKAIGLSIFIKYRIICSFLKNFDLSHFIFSFSLFIILVANKDLPPRFKKMFSHSSGGGSSSSDGEVSLRPAASSMMLKPKTPGVLPQSALGQQGNDHHIHSSLPLAPQPQPPNQKPTPPLMHKDPPILIKQASMEKSKANRNKVIKCFFVYFCVNETFKMANI